MSEKKMRYNTLFALSQGEPLAFVVNLGDIEATSIDAAIYNKSSRKGVKRTNMNVIDGNVNVEFSAEQTMLLPVGMATLEINIKDNANVSAIFFRDDFCFVRKSNESDIDINNQ